MSANSQSIDDTKVTCSYCNKPYAKSALKDHESTCLTSRTCSWCNVVFKNPGNLASHTKYLHKNEKDASKKKGEQVICNVCKKMFMNRMYLKYHIRQEHFNLKSKIAMRDNKKINQVWSERVINSNDVVEICRKENNIFLIKKCGERTGDLKVNEDYCFIDLSVTYPTKLIRVNCEKCNKSITQRCYKKHLDEVHKYKQIGKHHCNNCDKSFNRLYFFVKHKCSKPIHWRKRKVIIEKVENLQPITL